MWDHKKSDLVYSLFLEKDHRHLGKKIGFGSLQCKMNCECSIIVINDAVVSKMLSQICGSLLSLVFSPVGEKIDKTCL